jgi:hypothetical protein
MEFLRGLYENAMSNAERMTGAYEGDSEARWGLLIAVLAAVVAGFAIRAALKRKDHGRDNDG